MHSLEDIDARWVNNLLRKQVPQADGVCEVGILQQGSAG